MFSLVLVVLLAADAGTDAGTDAGLKVDAGSKLDAGLKLDAGTKSDAGVVKLDAGTKDAGTRDAGVKAPVLPVFPTALPDGGALAACKQKQIICFSPEGQCDLQVVALIDRAQPGGALDILIYSINRDSIVNAILRAKTRQVAVRIIADTSQIADPKEQSQLRRLLAAGIPMKRDTHQGIMHNKVVVRDNQEFLIGSFNFTNNASENSDENMLIWDCQRLAMVYETKFEQLWAKFKDASELVMRDAGTSKDGG